MIFEYFCTLISLASRYFSLTLFPLKILGPTLLYYPGIHPRFSILKEENRKYYFRITFCSDLICNKILMVRNSCVCGRVEFLAINVLLHTKSEQRVILIGN